MLTATIEFSLEELQSLQRKLSPDDKLWGVISDEIEKLELVDMSDWNDCGDACKL